MCGNEKTGYIIFAPEKIAPLYKSTATLVEVAIGHTETQYH